MTRRDGEKTIRLGLLGASNIATKVLPSIRTVSEIEVVAVAAERPGAAEAFAKKHQIERFYGSYRECLADADIDAVYISTLNSDHAAHIMQSLEAGKHVLCEKPLVPTRAEAEAAFALATKNNLVLLEGFMYRFHPQIKKLKEIIAAGTIGEIRSIRANFSFILYDFEGGNLPRRASAAAMGGALMDVGCYAVDFVNSIGGDTKGPPRVMAITRNRANDPRFDLSTSTVVTFGNDLTAVIECSADVPSLNTWEVSGTRGSVAALRFDPQGTTDVPLYLVNEESEAKVIECPSADTFAAEFRHFSRSTLNLETPHIRPDESIANAALLEGIRNIGSFS